LFIEKKAGEAKKKGIERKKKAKNGERFEK
jgi:hypothetical protein